MSACSSRTMELSNWARRPVRSRWIGVTAMRRLTTMIATKIEEEREAELDSIAGQQAQVGWGSQIDDADAPSPFEQTIDERAEDADKKKR